MEFYWKPCAGLKHSPLEGESVRQGLRPQSNRWGGGISEIARQEIPPAIEPVGVLVSQVRKRPLFRFRMTRAVVGAGPGFA